MDIKKAIIVSSIIVGSNGYAGETVNGFIVLQPNLSKISNISYARVHELLTKERAVEYGKPVGVQINENEGTADLSDFAGWVITVPLESARSQPNRTDPIKD